MQVCRECINANTQRLQRKQKMKRTEGMKKDQKENEELK